MATSHVNNLGTRLRNNVRIHVRVTDQFFYDDILARLVDSQINLAETSPVIHFLCPALRFS